MNLYLTADRVGAASGGGVVTRNELQALQEFSQESGDRDVFVASIDHTVHYPTPFDQDEYLFQYVKRLPEIPRITHCYSGCLTNTLQYLRQKGSKIVYTAAAHSVALSRKAHQEMGIAYDYPHLNDPVLWERYLEGYKTAQALVCPSTHSRDVMRSFGCTQPIHVIPHGIHPPGVLAWSPPHKFTVGYLGSYGPDKGIPTLLRAWNRFKLEDARLILAGRDSRTSYVQSLLFRNCPDASNIECLGWLEDISTFYRSLSVYSQPSACLLPGSPVFSSRGIVNIEQLTSQDHVLVDSGEHKRVEKPLCRHYSGEMISIRTTGLGDPIVMTPEHRVFVIRRGLASKKKELENRRLVYDEVMRMRQETGKGSSMISRQTGVNPRTIEGWFRGAVPRSGSSGHSQSLREDVLRGSPQWIPAGQLEEGDAVLFPRIKEETRLDWIDLPKRTPGSHGNRTSIIPDRLALDDDALQFLGYYVSEGCGQDNSVIFCFNTKEVEYIEDVSRVLREKFQLHHKISQRGNTTTVRVESVLLARFLTSHFGRGSHHVTIPDWVMKLPKEQLIPFVRGAWRGDGSTWALNGDRPSSKRGTLYTTVSRNLGYQLFCALVKLGFMPKLASRKISGNRRHKSGEGSCYEVRLSGLEAIRFAREILGMDVGDGGQGRSPTYIDDNFYYMPVMELARVAYSGDVYNLEVEENHCYAAPFIVHNSEGFGIEVLEAMSHGIPVLCSDHAGACDLVPGNYHFRAGDHNQLAGKLSQLRSILQTGNHDTISRNWRDIGSYYSWDRVRGMYRDLWRTLA